MKQENTKHKEQEVKSNLVRNYGNFRQQLLFDNVKDGYIHPTDIDACIHLQEDNLLILVEVKKVNNEMHTGQKWTMGDTVKKFSLGASLATGKRAFGIVVHATHATPNDEDVYLENCLVENAWYHVTATKSTPVENKLDNGITEYKLDTVARQQTKHAQPNMSFKQWLGEFARENNLSKFTEL